MTPSNVDEVTALQKERAQALELRKVATKSRLMLDLWFEDHRVGPLPVALTERLRLGIIDIATAAVIDAEQKLAERGVYVPNPEWTLEHDAPGGTPT